MSGGFHSPFSGKRGVRCWKTAFGRDTKGLLLGILACLGYNKGVLTHGGFLSPLYGLIDFVMTNDIAQFLYFTLQVSFNAYHTTSTPSKPSSNGSRDNNWSYRGYDHSN